MAKVAAAAPTAGRSSSWPPNSAPAKTMRFFVHCSGRSEAMSSAGTERDDAPVSAAICGRAAGDGETEAITTPGPLHVGGREAPDGVGLVVVRLEDGEQLGDRQQVG